MADPCETLRRELRNFAPRPHGYERVVKRLETKRHRQRVLAAAVAITIVLVGAALFAWAFRSEVVPVGRPTLTFPLGVAQGAS